MILNTHRDGSSFFMTGPLQMGFGKGPRRNFQDEVMPEISADQKLGKVIEIRGNNLIGVNTPDSDSLELALLPPRYRGVFFVRRGSFVIISPWAQPESGHRVTWYIDFILQPHHIKELRRAGRWPACFEKIKDKDESCEEEQTTSDGSDEDNTV